MTTGLGAEVLWSVILEIKSDKQDYILHFKRYKNMATAVLGGTERTHIRGKGKCTREQAFSVGAKHKEVCFFFYNFVGISGSYLVYRCKIIRIYSTFLQ